MNNETEAHFRLLIHQRRLLSIHTVFISPAFLGKILYSRCSRYCREWLIFQPNCDTYRTRPKYFPCRLNVSCISDHRVFFPIPGIIRRGDIPNSRIPQATDVVLSVSEDSNPSAPRQKQRDDWDILKATVY
uniref:Uncharacterized protein n=1 Tax=Triticum urartu TaxID=4572 RepID=A0A8R7P8B9_TRIUA